jgi:hypothetical protein
MLTREELSCNYLASTPAMAPTTPVMNINMRRLCFVLFLVMSTTAAFGAAFGDREDAASFRCGHHHDGRHGGGGRCCSAISARCAGRCPSGASCLYPVETTEDHQSTTGLAA